MADHYQTLGVDKNAGPWQLSKMARRQLQKQK